MTLWCLSPSNGFVMFRPYQVEYVKQVRLVLLLRTVWRFQSEDRRDHAEWRLIQEENCPVLQVLLGAVGQHQVGQEP